ncbi:MAG: matrixin family metalloprotease, partial [Candidatus Magnetoovum sp. WYHC-5]|nr:matrixin family metalloprotease [Candidatus Magnetoovum sp. WYHC-5]
MRPWGIFLTVMLLVAVLLNDSYSYTLSGQKWSNSSATFYVGYDSGQYDDAFIEALQSWNSLSKFAYLYTKSSADSCTQDYKNGYGFSSTYCGTQWSSGTLATSAWYYNPSTNAILESDITFNSNVTWSIFNGIGSGSTDFRRVAVHELGHSLGLEHSATKAAVMYPTYQATIEVPQTDDINGLVAMYGASASTPTPTPTVTPTPTLTPTPTPTPTSTPSTTIDGDINGDGKADLVGVASTGQVWYSTNLTTWTALSAWLSQVAKGDLSGDGRADLVGIASTGQVWYSTNLTTWTALNAWLSQVTTGDINGDGRADLIGVASTGQVWYSTNLTTWTALNA